MNHDSSWVLWRVTVLSASHPPLSWSKLLFLKSGCANMYARERTDTFLYCWMHVWPSWHAVHQENECENKRPYQQFLTLTFNQCTLMRAFSYYVNVFYVTWHEIRSPGNAGVSCCPLHRWISLLAIKKEDEPGKVSICNTRYSMGFRQLDQVASDILTH